MIKFLHTADLHINCTPSSTGLPRDIRERLLLDPLLALEYLAHYAHQANCDAILIAGDLFDHPHVDRETIKPVVHALSVFSPRPVFIVAGNHDPLRVCSAWHTAHFPDNVHIFRSLAPTPAPVPGTDAIIWGSSWQTSDAPRCAFEGFAVPPEYANKKNVFLAHASETNTQPPSWKQYAPLDLRAVPARHVEYFALGHLHNAQPIRITNSPPAWYPGSPCITGANESGRRSALLVTIDDLCTDVARIFTPSLYRHHAVFSVNENTTLPQYKNFLATLCDDHPENALAEVTLLGMPPATVKAEFARIADRFRSKFADLFLADFTIDVETIKSEIPADTAFGRFLAELTQLRLTTTDPELQATLQNVQELALASYQYRAQLAPRPWVRPPRELR